MVKQFSTSSQKKHENEIRRKYIRTEKAWDYVRMDKRAERIDPSKREDIVKLRKILDRSLHNSKGYVTKKEIFEAIGFKPPYHGNPRYRHINETLSRWYRYDYISILPEKLENPNPFNLYQ